MPGPSPKGGISLAHARKPWASMQMESSPKGGMQSVVSFISNGQQFDMSDCAECVRLRHETSELFSEYIACRDDLAITRKKDKSFSSKKRAYERATRQLRECQKREKQHRAENHYGYGSPDENLTIQMRLDELGEYLSLHDEEDVQRVVFELGVVHNGWNRAPDEVVEGLLTMLRTPELQKSDLAGHVLNYFELESTHLTARQKSLCSGFVAAHYNSFNHAHSMQVVTELRYGNWLKE